MFIAYIDLLYYYIMYLRVAQLQQLLETEKIHKMSNEKHFSLVC